MKSDVRAKSLKIFPLTYISGKRTKLKSLREFQLRIVASDLPLFMGAAGAFSITRHAAPSPLKSSRCVSLRSTVCLFMRNEMRLGLVLGNNVTDEECTQ